MPYTIFQFTRLLQDLTFLISILCRIVANFLESLTMDENAVNWEKVGKRGMMKIQKSLVRKS
jgi:hypothetical protein